MPDDRKAAEHFANEIELLIRRTSYEYDMTVLEVVGVLEAVKFRALQAAWESDDMDMPDRESG